MSYFSEKFNKLRQEKNLTQEQIADIFNVSPQSVSRWETGANYPDIELLPHIAIFFKVTVDELLGTEKILGEEKVNEYGKDIRNMLNSGKVYESIDLARKAVKEYPLNTELQYLLVQALANNDSEKHKDEIIAIGERIINLADFKSSVGNRVQLIRQYAGWGMKEEAKKLLDTLPDTIWDAKEVWKGLILEGEEWEKNQKWSILRGTMLLAYFVDTYIGKADFDTLQKIEWIKKSIEIESTVSLVSDDGVDLIWRALQYINIAGLYCEASDIENALDYAEKATQDALCHVEQMYKTNEGDGGNYMPFKTSRNLPWILWEDHLMKPQFDIVKNDERFIKCFDVLKANSRELK